MPSLLSSSHAASSLGFFLLVDASCALGLLCSLPATTHPPPNPPTLNHSTTQPPIHPSTQQPHCPLNSQECPRIPTGQTNSIWGIASARLLWRTACETTARYPNKEGTLQPHSPTCILTMQLPFAFVSMVRDYIQSIHSPIHCVRCLLARSFVVLCNATLPIHSSTHPSIHFIPSNPIH